MPSDHVISCSDNDQDSNVKTMMKRELKEIEAEIKEKLEELENEVKELKSWLSLKGEAGAASCQASGSSRLGRRTTSLQPGWISKKSQVLPSDNV
jgi:hypothetical protein